MWQVINFTQVVYKMMSLEDRLIIAQNGLIKVKDKGTRSMQRVTDFKGSHVLLINARWEITVKLSLANSSLLLSVYNYD
jgi:hypothetical protein